jgi:hypothetical protein
MRLTWLGLVAALAAGVTLGAGGEPATSQGSQTPPRGPVACGRGGIDVTVALAYDSQVVGDIAGTYADLRWSPPLELPRSAEKLHARLTSLLPSGAKLGTPKLGAGTLRVPLTTEGKGIPPANAFGIRYDCPVGSHVRPSALSCATAGVVSASGQPLDESLARTVRCLVVALDPVGR